MFKKLKKMLMVLLIIPALFVFGACKNKNNNPDSGNPPAVTPSNPEEPGGGEPSTPEEPGGEDPTPSAENYVVSVEYCLPEGFEVLSNYSVTKEVWQTFTLPEIADENLSEFFLGWYDKATEERREKILKVCEDFSEWISSAPDEDLDYQFVDVSNFEKGKIENIINSFYGFTFDTSLNVPLYKFLVLKDNEKSIILANISSLIFDYTFINNFCELKAKLMEE